MIHIGGVSLDTPAAAGTESAGNALGETLAAVSDDTDIERTISCRGIEREPDDGGPRSTSNGMLVVTHRAVHVFSEGVETDADDVGSIPFTAIDDAQTSGLVRRRLTITTEEATYEITAEGRPDLNALARFLRRASWSWGRVTPRLDTARTAIEALETDLQAGELESLERDKHRAKMALSKAQSTAGRLDVAVDAIEGEIDRLRERLQYQQVRWHVLQGEDDAETARAKLANGLAHAAQPLFEDAREHFEQALSLARETGATGSKQIRHRLEEIREQLYDLEVEPRAEAYEAVERALAAESPDGAAKHWRAARTRYDEALETAVETSPIRFQLAWVDANFVRACREYARELETDADEHAANGHDQWARQLYMAADDQLVDALAVAREQDNLDTEPLEAHHERLVGKHADGSFEWPAAEVTSD